MFNQDLIVLLQLYYATKPQTQNATFSVFFYCMCEYFQHKYSFKVVCRFRLNHVESFYCNLVLFTGSFNIFMLPSISLIVLLPGLCVSLPCLYCIVESQRFCVHCLCYLKLLCFSSLLSGIYNPR